MRAALMLLAACGGYTSSYTRSRIDHSELVWRYDDHLQVTRDGKIVAEQGDWDDLTGVVACVPQAHEFADSAASRQRSGKLLTWSGVAVVAAGLAIGTAIAVSDTSNSDNLLIGGGAMLGGLVVGLPVMVGGLVTSARSNTAAIDAVNAYNDGRGGCGQLASDRRR